MRKCLLMIIMIAASALMAGCNIEPDKAWDDYEATMGIKASVNSEAIDKLYNSGLLSKEQSEDMKESISKYQKELQESLKKLEDGDDIRPYISFALRSYSGKTDDKPKLKYYLKKASAGNIEGRDSGATGLRVISDADEKTINELCNYKVYVLKSPTGKKYNGLHSLSELANAVYILKQEESDNKKSSQHQAAIKILNEYFSDSGEKLVDTTSSGVPILKETVMASGNDSTLGKDLTLTSDGVVTMKIRMYEFNPDAIDLLCGAAEGERDKYYVDTAQGIVYLMEYPIAVAQTLKTVEKDGETQYQLDFEDKATMFRGNIATGQMASMDGTVWEVEGDYIYSTSGEKGGASSFAISGQTEYDDIGAKKKTIKGCHRVVLLDYLEMSPMPDLVKDEEFVALGRRIRLKRRKGTYKQEIGVFVDKNGKVADASPKILATDMIDNRSLKAGKKSEGGYETDGKVVKLALKEKKGTGKNKKAEKEEETGLASAQKYKHFPAVYDDVIKLKLSFPGNVDKADKGSVGDGKTMMRFAGLATDANIFDTALYSNWINIEGDGDGNGSLEWWNTWLKDNSYQYYIDPNTLMAYLGENYSYEMSGEGQIILDLETIGKIQDGYDEDDRRDLTASIRTASVALGIILIAYSVLIVGAWIFDTSLVAGPKLLKFLSFGQWTAITNDDEVPYVDTDKQQFVKLKDVVIRAVVICCIAAALTLLDVISILHWIVNTFGGLIGVIKGLLGQ